MLQPDSLGLGVQRCQGLLRQGQGSAEGLLRFHRVLPEKLRLPQGGVEHERKVVIGNLPDLALDTGQTGQGSVELAQARFQSSRPDLVLETAGAGRLGLRSRCEKPGGFRILLCGDPGQTGSDGGIGHRVTRRGA